MAPPIRSRKWIHIYSLVITLKSAKVIYKSSKGLKICFMLLISISLGGGEVALEDVLSFFCGASKIPPLGFDSTPALSFSDSAIYPTASTCALHLTLPTKYHSNYSLFKEKMTQAITCHRGFGML